jgi:hypothetical protein
MRVRLFIAGSFNRINCTYLAKMERENGDELGRIWEMVAAGYHA